MKRNGGYKGYMTEIIIAVFISLFELMLLPEMRSFTEYFLVIFLFVFSNIFIVLQVEEWIEKYQEILEHRKRISYKERRKTCQSEV